MPPITHRFTSAQIEILATRAISPEMALAAGVRSAQTVADLPAEAPDYWTEAEGYLPGLLFTYRGPDGAEELQLRPDVPVVDLDVDDGRPKKYVFAKGARSVLHAARPDDAVTNVLLVEGTCQAIAAGHYAPDGWAVYGIAGCQSWMQAGVPTAGLEVVDGRRVFVALDADAESNRAVYDAGVKLARALEMNGAREVRFIRSAGGQKAGLDDVLAGAPTGRRQRLLEGLVAATEALKPADKPSVPARRRPEARKADREGGESPWFDVDGALLVEKLAGAIRDEHSCLLGKDDNVAVFRNGAYTAADRLAVGGAITDRLGDLYTTGRESNVEKFLINELNRLGERLPEHSPVPMINFTNGMLDLRTGQMVDHDPKYRSQFQLTVPWDPEAVCPQIDAWLAEMAGPQVDALLEAAGAFLDPTRLASKALFLFGPPRSGKSTFLVLLEALVGEAFVSGVSLHQLADDQFAGADLYGKVINVDADVKASDVQDISMFKKMTGGDVIQANKKYGGRFAYRNRAMFAFSANELPAVSENSRAYVARIVPVLFGKSVEGREDAGLGARLLEELPGLAVRLVRAHMAWRERGVALAPHPRVVALFEEASDRVRQWMADRCELVTGQQGQPAFGATVTELHRSFGEWAKDGEGRSLGRKAFGARLGGLPGAVQVKDGDTGRRGWNVRIRDDASWTESNVWDVAEEVMAGTAVTAVSAQSSVSQDGHSDSRSSLSIATSTSEGAQEVDHEESTPVSKEPLCVETAVTAVPEAPKALRGSKILQGIKMLAPERPRQMSRCRVCQKPLELYVEQLLLCPDRHRYIPEA